MKGLPFSAMLLFQFRAEKNGKSNRKRLCETRILTFRAESSQAAYQAALAKGKKAEFHLDNASGGITYFEFVGIRELLYLGYVDSRDEVWFDMFEMDRPSENVSKLIPPKSRLSAIKDAKLVIAPAPSPPKTPVRRGKQSPRRIAVLPRE